MKIINIEEKMLPPYEEIRFDTFPSEVLRRYTNGDWAHRVYIIGKTCYWESLEIPDAFEQTYQEYIKPKCECGIYSSLTKYFTFI